MAIDKQKRFELGNHIKVLLAKYQIKQTDIAELCNVSRQYVSQICSGRNPMSAEQYKKIYDLFCDLGATRAELREFSRLHIASKMNIETTVDNKQVSMQEHFLELFDQLSAEQKLKVLAFMRNFISVS